MIDTLSDFCVYTIYGNDRIVEFKKILCLCFISVYLSSCCFNLHTICLIRLQIIHSLEYTEMKQTVIRVYFGFIINPRSLILFYLWISELVWVTFDLNITEISLTDFEISNAETTVHLKFLTNNI